MSTIRSKLQKQAKSALLQYAFLRWESAVVIAGAILLTALWPKPFKWWPVWGWPLLGLLGLAAFFWLFINAVVLIFRDITGPRIGLVIWPATFLTAGLTGFNIYHSWYQALLSFFIVLIGIRPAENLDAK